MSPARLTIVSDSHLSPRTPEAIANWSAVVDHVATVSPDLVVHLGDLSLDGMRDADDLYYSREQLERLDAPWLVVPGNHDIGDNPSPESPPGFAVDAERQLRWLDILGDDRWSVEVAGWKLIGVNAQLFGSGLPAEDDQWSWMEAEVGAESGERPLALMIHKPIDADEAELTGAPHYRFVPAPSRQRLAGLLDGRPWDLVISGHVHQYRHLQIGATTHVWAPTTWAVLPDDAQETFGVKRCGVLSVDLDGGSARAALVEPPALRQLTLERDLPDPYSHAPPS